MANEPVTGRRAGSPTGGTPVLVAVAWPYASGSRHLGHLAGAYLPADVYARHQRLVGNRVLMVSGSDVHGTPITVRADAEDVTPADIVERWTYDALGEPITIGTVTIRSGDWLLADRDGVVIIPQEIAEDATAETEKVVSTEGDMRKAILDGMDPEQAYLKFGKF